MVELRLSRGPWLDRIPYSIGKIATGATWDLRHDTWFEDQL